MLIFCNGPKLNLKKVYPTLAHGASFCASVCSALIIRLGDPRGNCQIKMDMTPDEHKEWWPLQCTVCFLDHPWAPVILLCPPTHFPLIILSHSTCLFFSILTSVILTTPFYLFSIMTSRKSLSCLLIPQLSGKSPLGCHHILYKAQANTDFFNNQNCRSSQLIKIQVKDVMSRRVNVTNLPWEEKVIKCYFYTSRDAIWHSKANILMSVFFPGEKQMSWKEG